MKEFRFFFTPPSFVWQQTDDTRRSTLSPTTSLCLLLLYHSDTTGCITGHIMRYMNKPLCTSGLSVTELGGRKTNVVVWRWWWWQHYWNPFRIPLNILTSALFPQKIIHVLAFHLIALINSINTKYCDDRDERCEEMSGKRQREKQEGEGKAQQSRQQQKWEWRAAASVGQEASKSCSVCLRGGVAAYPCCYYSCVPVCVCMA